MDTGNRGELSNPSHNREQSGMNMLSADGKNPESDKVLMDRGEPDHHAFRCHPVNLQELFLANLGGIRK